MIRNCIVRDYSKYARAYGFDGTDYDTEIEYQSLKERMRTNAIHDNGIAKTFCFSDHCYKLTLDYIKIEDEDIELYPDMFEQKSDCRLIYLCDDPPDESLFNPYNSLEFQDILSSCLLYNEIDDTLNREFEIIKKECVEKYNAVYSSVNIDNVEINKYHKIIYIHYSYHYIKDDFIDKISTYDVIFGETPLPYGEWFIDYFGPNPKDRPRKDGIVLTKDVEAALNKGYIDCTAPVFTANRNRNDRIYSENAIKKLLNELH